MSAFDDIGDVAPQQIWDGVSGRVVHGERITMGIVELEPSSVVPEHSHENEQVGIVLQGSLVFRIGEESRELSPGALYRIPANTSHELETGAEGAVVVDVFAPLREDWQGLAPAEPRAPRWPPAGAA